MLTTVTSMADNNLINLKSTEGQTLLERLRSGTATGALQTEMLEVFGKQTGSKNCGIQSSALIWTAALLNAKRKAGSTVDVNQMPYTEAKLLQMEAVRTFVDEEFIETNGGICLQDLANINKSVGHDAEVFNAANSSVQEFRERALEVLRQPCSMAGIIVNYHMATIGQSPPYGHHSPLAGYDETTDRFLIMDTWYETEECWVKTESLFKAMDTIDDASGKARGFCIVRKFNGLE